MAEPHSGDKPGQRHFRCIGHAAEHRLSEKGAAELYAIKTADQLPLMPAFDRVGMADRVEPERGALDDRVDPGLRSIGARQKDFVKGHVAGDSEAARPHPPGERA